MMETRRSWWLAALALSAFMAIALMFSLGAGTAHAAEKAMETGKGTIKVFPGDPIYLVAASPNGKKPTQVKISKTSVVKKTHVNKEYIELWAKKPGTAKLSYKYKGKTHKFTIKVCKYTNPFKSISVGGKKLDASAYSENLTFATPFYFDTKKSGAVKIQTSKNWTLKKIILHYKNGSKKVVKNGKGKFTSNVDYVEFKIKNKKTNVTYDGSIERP